MGPEDVSLLERCPHFRGCYVQASMELGPEDVERCPHFIHFSLQVLFFKIEALEKTGSTVDDVIDFIVKELEHLARDVTGEQGLFMTIKVDDLLFGYNDSLLNDLKRLLYDSVILRKYADLINPLFGLEVRTVHVCIRSSYIYNVHRYSWMNVFYATTYMYVYKIHDLRPKDTRRTTQMHMPRDMCCVALSSVFLKNVILYMYHI